MLNKYEKNYIKISKIWRYFDGDQNQRKESVTFRKIR